MPKWDEITRNEKYQNLPPEARAQIKTSWFETNLLPEIEKRPSLKEMGVDKVYQWFMQQPDDTGQGYVSSMLGAAGRGFGEVVPGAIEGVGALTGLEGLRETGQELRSGLESISPVNPIYAESVPVKLAGFGGQIGSVVATAGTGGLAGKMLGGVGAVSKGAKTASLGSAFLQGAAEGAREAEQYGMTGPEAYLRTLAGGATEAGTELLPFGMAAETALAKRVLAGTPRTGTFLGATASEGAEESLAQIGSNIATKLLAPAGVETPDITAGALEAGLYGAAGGAMLGGVNALISTPPERQTQIQKDLQAEAGAIPKDTVPDQTNEEKLAAMEAGGTTVVDPDGKTAVIPLQQPELPSMPSPDEVAVQLNTDAAKSLKAAGSSESAKAQAGFDATLKEILPKTSQPTIPTLEEAEKAPTPTPISIADSPSPNLLPRATENVEPKPTRNAGESREDFITRRDAWDEQYGGMRKGGRTHNDDGTPYQPTVYDEVAPAILAARQQMTDDEANERIGESSETRIATFVKTLLDAGWTWDTENQRWQQPENNPVPNESPLAAILRLQGKTQNVAPSTAPTATQAAPATAPAPKQSAAEKALGLPAGTLAPSATPPSPQTGQAAAPAVEPPLPPPNPEFADKSDQELEDYIKNNLPTRPMPPPFFPPDATEEQKAEIRENFFKPRRALLEKELRAKRAERKARAQKVEAPTFKEEDQGAVSMPMMVTRDMKQQLVDLGYSKTDINSMRPEEAAAIIKSGVSKKTISPEMGMPPETPPLVAEVPLPAPAPVSKQDLLTLAKSQPVGTKFTDWRGDVWEKVPDGWTLTSKQFVDARGVETTRPMTDEVAIIDLRNQLLAAPVVEEPTLTPEPELYAPDQVPSEESVYEEPKDGIEGRKAEEPIFGDSLLRPAEGEVKEEVMPLPEVAADPFAAAPLVDNLPALIAVRDNNATPEQVQSLVDQGLVEQVDGQNIITEAGVAAMPEDQRPKLTPAERAAEVEGMGVPESVAAERETDEQRFQRIKSMSPSQRTDEDIVFANAFSKRQKEIKPQAGESTRKAFLANHTASIGGRLRKALDKPITFRGLKGTVGSWVENLFNEGWRMALDARGNRQFTNGTEALGSSGLGKVGMNYADFLSSQPQPTAAEKPTPDSVAVEPGATRGVQPEPVGGSILTVGKVSPETEISSRENLGPEVAVAEKKQAAADEAAKKRQKKQDESTKNSLNSILDPQKKNAVTGTVTKVDVETAREALTNSGEIPNAYLTNVYESVEAFLADKANARLFPSAYARLQTEKNIEGLYENGQTLIFAKQIQVSNLDRNLAKMLGITPEQAAARRVIAHENGHKAISLFTLAEKRELRGYLMRAYSDEQIAKLVETYDEYADWRTNLESRFEALEELLMRDFEKMDKIPTGGVWDDIVQFLKRVWRRLTGQKGEPTLKNLKDVARLMRNAMKRPVVPLGSFTLKDGGKVKLSAIAPTAGITPEMDAEYLAAVEAGDMEKAQRMVDEAAKAAGYDSDFMLFHGTTHDFYTFTKERANIENDFGKGFYFTSSLDDVEENYAGFGPDLTNRIEREAEKIESNENLPRDEALNEAKKKLAGETVRKIQAYLRLQNPVRVGGDDETFFDYEESYDEDSDEFGEPTGKLVELIDAIKSATSNFDEADADVAAQALLEKALDSGGLKASEVVEILKGENGGLIYATDENGDLASSEIIRQAFEEAGFDGIEDFTVDEKFGSSRKSGQKMTGVSEDTVHKIAFDPNQIKSADPVTFDNAGNVIPLSQRFQPTSPDIRFSRPQFASDTDAATSAGNEAARSTIYSERDMDVREAIRRAYEAMPKDTSVAVPIGELFAKTEELMPGVTQDEFSNVLQDLFEDNGAVLQEGEVVEPLTEQDRRYLALAEDEEANQEELQRMVDEAAIGIPQKTLTDAGLNVSDITFEIWKEVDTSGDTQWWIMLKDGWSIDGTQSWTEKTKRAVLKEAKRARWSPDTRAILRDDQGRIIPLSRRFDTGADIRGQINVTTPEGRRAGFVVVMPMAAKASKIPIEDAEEASKSFKVDLAEAGKGRVDKKAKFKGIPLKDTEIPEHNVKSYVLYRDSAIKLIDDLMAKTNDILVVAEALQDPEFQIAIGLQVSKDVSSDMITIARNQIGIEIENRLANEIRKERNPRRKRELELAEKRGIIYYNAGTGAGQALQNRQESLTDPRYRGRNLFNQAKLQKEQKAKDKLDAITGGTEKITDIITKAEEKAAEETTQAEVEAQESAVEDDEYAKLVSEGEEGLEGRRKTIWERAKMILRRLAMYARADKLDIKEGSKASLSAEQRKELDELNAILRMPKAERDKAREKDLAEFDALMTEFLGLESEAKTPEQKKTRKKREKMVNTAKKRAEAGKSLETPQEGETESSEEQVSKAERTTQAILKDLSERYSDPLIIKEKKPNVDAMRELYKERVKQGVGPNQMTEKSFVNKAVELGADETTAGILWKAAELEIDAREAMRQDKILQRKAAVGARADAQAHRIIFAKERLKRQSGFAGIDTNPNKDTIIQAFRDQVKNPVSLEDFVARLKSLNVSETVAKRLFTAAEREKIDLEAMEAFKALEGPDALKRMLNEMNKARPADSVPLERAMPWRKILSSNPKDVAEYRQRIFEAISDLPSFQNLTDEQKERLADLYAEAWENRKQAILDRMLRDEIKKARDRDEISEDVEKKLQQSRNKILEIVNLGGFNNDDLVKVLGERYGISTSFTEEQKERIQKLADQLQDEDMNTAKRNKLAMEFAVELAGAMDVPVSEIISNWWTSSVLFGPQTIFSIGAAFLNGGYSIATIGTRRMLAKLVKGDIQGAIEESILMLKGFARYLGAFKQSGRRAWSYLWTGDVGLLGTGSTDILSEINNFDQLQRFQRHKLLAEKLAKDPRMVRRYVGVYLRFVSRLLTALDAFNVMVTKAGTASLALRMSGMSTDKIIEAEKMLNLKAYKDQVIRDYFDNKAPKTQAEKALVDSYAEAEMYRAINKLGGKMENADYLASESAMTMHPTGFGGVVYDAITGFFAQRQSNADEYLEKMKKDWISNKDLKAVTFLALAYLRQFAAYNAAGLTGSKFVRYASNKFNQGLSFIPFAGLLRQLEAKDDRIKGKDAFRETIYRNQIVSFVMLMVGYAVVKAIQDEPDDEERGNFWNGGWSNLTPDQKKQMLAKGQKEYTMGFKFNGRWYVFNYQNWPLNQILSAIGSMSDQIRFSPEKWDEKSALSKGVAGMVSGVKSTLEIPALSGLQELVGNRLASKDPTEKELDRLSRVASGWVGGFVPRILKDIDFYTQPELRKYEGLWEKTASHIPIYRRYVGEEYYDILGKQIKRNVIPGSREFMMGPTEPEYKILGALNARNIFLTPANAEYRMVGKGRNRRRLTQEEADAYSLETGRGYRDMLLRYGQRALQMPTERARAFLQDKAEEVRDRALKRAYRR